MCEERPIWLCTAERKPPPSSKGFWTILESWSSDPIGALAFLQLARAYSMSEDRTRAKSAYEGFLKLWKGADPEIPILKQAEAEYSKLQ